MTSRGTENHALAPTLGRRLRWGLAWGLVGYVVGVGVGLLLFGAGNLRDPALMSFLLAGPASAIGWFILGWARAGPPRLSR